MRADLEMRLIHNGFDWVVSNEKIEAKGETFGALDENLRRVLIDTAQYKKGQKVTVFMGYDFSTFPTWLRQYHTHYFNRIANLQL